MNNQSSYIDCEQSDSGETSVLSDIFSPIIAVMMRLNDYHRDLSTESACLFLRLVRNEELIASGRDAVATSGEGGTGDEAIASLQDALLINTTETGSMGTLSLTARGKLLAAEISDLMAPRASPPQQ